MSTISGGPNAFAGYVAISAGLFSVLLAILYLTDVMQPLRRRKRKSLIKCVVALLAALVLIFYGLEVING
jgi:hypothetical protein